MNTDKFEVGDELAINITSMLGIFRARVIGRSEAHNNTPILQVLNTKTGFPRPDFYMSLKDGDYTILDKWTDSSG